MFRVSLLWRCFSALCFLHLVLHFVSSSAIPSTTRSCCHKNAESPADQGHEVVDLFSSVLVSTFNANDMKYITHGDFWLLMRYNLLLTKRNSVRIHILTDSNDLLVRGQEAGFHMHKVEMNNTFYDMYAPNHLSVLGSDAKFVKYEYFNFYRWIKYSEIVNDWNTKNAKDPVLQIKNIVAIDADVMFLLNPHKLFFRVLHSLGYTSSEDNFDMATVAPGAVQVFSATGLNKYGSFIYDWYNRPKQAIAADMDTIAGKVFDHQHFSDMQMGILFSHQNEVARSLCFQYDPALRSVVLLNRSKIDRCMIDKLECVPAHAYSKLEPELSTMKIHDQRVYVGQDEKVAQCFMVSVHFIVMERINYICVFEASHVMSYHFSPRFCFFFFWRLFFHSISGETRQRS